MRLSAPFVIAKDHQIKQIKRFSAYGIAQTANFPAHTMCAMEGIPKASRSPDDFQLAVLVGAGHVYKRSNVLLAKAHFSGTLELMTAAWERLLGYGRQEFAGKTLCQLMRSQEPVATDAVSAILDELNPGPVDLKVRCRNGKGKRLRLHRRFDPDERTMFIVAEEILEN